MVSTWVLSTCRWGKCSSKSLNVKMCNSLRNKSPLKVVTPCRYSMGEDNMFEFAEIRIDFIYKGIEANQLIINAISIFY